MEKIKNFFSILVILGIALSIITGIVELALYFGRVFGYLLAVGLSSLVILASFEVYDRSK